MDIGGRDSPVECPTGCGPTPCCASGERKVPPHDDSESRTRPRRARRRATLLALAVVDVGAPSRGPASRASGPTKARRARRRRPVRRTGLTRIVRGPEPTSFAIPAFHKDLLLDAERNLAALPEPTLDLLADPALVARLQAQDDANPWHAILAVLARIGTRRPDVARAWAEPALRHGLLTLRRAALAGVRRAPRPRRRRRRSPPRSIATRRTACSGPDWRRASSTWAPRRTRSRRVQSSRARRPTDHGCRAGCGPIFRRSRARRRAGARPDLLAWWAFLTETAGPRRADPARGGAGRGRSIDPAVLSVVAVPHALTSGSRAAAIARRALARLGSETARRFADADRRSPDADVAEVATEILERPATDAGARGDAGARRANSWRRSAAGSRPHPTRSRRSRGRCAPTSPRRRSG